MLYFLAVWEVDELEVVAEANDEGELVVYEREVLLVEGLIETWEEVLGVLMSSQCIGKQFICLPFREGMEHVPQDHAVAMMAMP